MPDLLNTGASWLADQLHANASRTIAYTRGAYSVSLTAVIGRTGFRQMGSNGRSQLIFSDRDFMIQAADLILNSETVKPEAGDQITDSDGTFVLTTFNGEPCYRTSDTHGYQLRCHTKKIGE